MTSSLWEEHNWKTSKIQKWSVVKINLLVCDLVVSVKPVKTIRIPPRRKTWKLKDTVVQKEFEQAVSMKCQQIPAKVESVCEYNLNGFLEAADEMCEWTQGGCPRHKETWWWDNVDNAVKEKRKAWKQWKNGGTKKNIWKPKMLLKHLYVAKWDAQTKQFASTNNMAKRLKWDNVDIVGE